VTTKGLEQLNRRNRILDGIRAGQPYKEVALREGCRLQWVSRVALAAGIRRQERLAGRRRNGIRLDQEHQEG
jgi:hypothetical protein